jgi:two-component system nitrogen regulation response regulator NtrX
MPEETAGGSILIVDDEKGVRDSLQLVLEYEGYRIMKASTGHEGLDKVEDGEPDVILLDVKMPGLDGLEVLERLRPAETGRVVVMISGHADIATAVEATRMGAFDFLEKPLDQEKVLLTVRNAMSKAQLERQNRLLRREVEEHYMLVAQSAVMQEVLSQMERVAETDARVLITGENGTGKELIARRLHGFSGRAGGPFVPVNCAAIPRDLIESELFGHVKGAFTGAQSNKVGKFELASGGTLFLDEVGDMSLSAQAKVLRALEEGVVERVGGSSPIRIDVRVIAATNMDLEAQIEAGQFRKDLYYRLRVVPLPIPPLRERPEDIGPLCDHFLAYYAAMDKRSPRVLSSDARLRFQEYPWPGNVRELRNAMERLVIMSEGETIMVTDVDAILLDRGAGAQGGLEDLAHFLRDVPDLGSFRDETEKLYLLKVLQDNNWNVSAAARIMGIQRSNLYRKLEKHGIERGDTLETSAGGEER